MIKALKLVMLNIIQKAKIEIDFDGFEIGETVCNQIRYKWIDYTNYIIGEKVREYHFDESLVFEYFLFSKNNKECLDIDECFEIFTSLEEDILKEWEIRKAIREYEMTLYLVLLNYLTLLEEDTNNLFLQSLLSNNWSEEAINSLEIDDYFNREYPIREMLNEYKDFKKKDLEAV